MQRVTLNIGKLADGTQWLCLADSDTSNVYPLAQFTNDDCATVFQQYMETQGYAAVKLPNDDEINKLLEES